MNTEVVLGTVQFGLNYGVNNPNGKPNKEVVFKILDHAYEAGIHSLDTAQSYGNSEELLGEYFTIRKNNKFSVFSKFHFLPNSNISVLLENTLKKLNLSQLKGFSFHSYDDFEKFEDYDEIIKLKKENLLENLGVSVYSNEQAIKALENLNIDFIQMPFNLFDNYLKKQNIFELAKIKNKKVQIRSLFLQGLFFKDVISLKGTNLEPLTTALNQLKNICVENNISMEELAYSYASSFDCIDSLVFGVDNVDQLLANIDMTSKKLKNNIIDKIHKISIDKISLLNPSTWNLK